MLVPELEENAVLRAAPKRAHGHVIYATQLQKLAQAVRERRPRQGSVFLLHDNAKAKAELGDRTPSAMFS